MPDKVDVLVRVQNSSTMSYNIVNHLHKMQVTFPIMEVMKIPQQKDNLFKSFEDENLKEKWIEPTIMTQKSQPKRVRVPPFFISSETDDFIIHNCMVDSGAIHHMIPLLVMRTIRLDCTRHYQADECIFIID